MLIYLQKENGNDENREYCKFAIIIIIWATYSVSMNCEHMKYESGSESDEIKHFIRAVRGIMCTF